MERWEPEEIEKLRGLLVKGMNMSDAARYLNRPKGSVIGVIARLPALRALRPKKCTRRVVPSLERRTLNERSAEVRNPIIPDDGPDMRSLTARLMGDPPPSRSALAMRNEGAR